MIIRNRQLDFNNHTYVMGILNVTPDSFSDGGLYCDTDTAIQHALLMQEEGAAIIDVGGESTRPGFETISDEEEISRVVPVIKGIRERSDVLISIDTYKPAVLQAALEAGADIANDVSFGASSEYIKIAAKCGAPYILMHNTAWHNKDNYCSSYEDYVEDMSAGVARLKRNGITESQIILDPGVGFGKSDYVNMDVVKRIVELGNGQYPILLAASNKSIIGRILDVPVGERAAGTMALTAHAVMNRIGMVRVHNVKDNVHVIKVLEALRDNQ